MLSDKITITLTVHEALEVANCVAAAHEANASGTPLSFQAIYFDLIYQISTSMSESDADEYLALSGDRLKDQVQEFLGEAQ